MGGFERVDPDGVVSVVVVCGYQILVYCVQYGFLIQFVELGHASERKSFSLIPGGIVAEFSPLAGFLDFTGGCANVEFYDSVTPLKCEHAELSYTLPVGQTVVFVSPASWNPQDECGSDYFLTIDGYECTSPVRETHWGTIKALYR